MPRSVQNIIRPLHIRSFTSCAARRDASLPRTIRQVVETARKGTHSTKPDSKVEVNGWVRSVRRQKNVAFVQLSDGTELDGRALQVVFEKPVLVDTLTMGTSVKIGGRLVESPGREQDIEVNAESVEILGSCDPETYPIQKKTHTAEFLRDHANFRARTDQIAKMLRLRHAARRAFEDYYDSHGFLSIHAPVLTMNDCEGGGEVFRVVPDQPTKPGDGEEMASASDGNSSEPFFGRPVFLTVSSQLHLEVFTSAFPRVYTLQPAFRAEGSHTNRHLSEFWMLEAEMAFVDDVAAIMDILESSVKHLLASQEVKGCVDPDQVSYFDRAGNAPWPRITYTQAVDLIQAGLGRHSIRWGDSISAEQERWLADTAGEGLPVFVTNYPAELKPFYMRPTATTHGDRRTVACFDLLVSRIGELAGGSMREERPEQIENVVKRLGMDPEQYKWYTELRRFGTTPHGGFGLGFERLISWIGGWENVRECIPAPRWKGRCIL